MHLFSGMNFGKLTLYKILNCIIGFCGVLSEGREDPVRMHHAVSVPWVKTPSAARSLLEGQHCGIGGCHSACSLETPLVLK